MATGQRKFSYVEKWLTNEQINKKSSTIYGKQKNNGRPNHPNIKI